MLPEPHSSRYSILSTLISHIEQAKGNNLWQFQQCPNIESLLTILLNPLNNVQLDLIQVQSALGLDVATGNTLDLIGKVLGREREENQSDTDYREILYAHVLKNTNQGTLNEFLIITAKLLQKEVADKAVFATEIFPAGMITTVEGTDNVIRLGEQPGLNALLPAGVGTGINVFLEGCTPFGFEGSGGAPLDTGCFVAAYLTGPNRGITPFALDVGTFGGLGMDSIGQEDQGQFVTSQASLENNHCV